MNEFGPWDQFVAFVNRAGYAWKNLLGQDKDLDLRKVGQIVFPAKQKASSDANTFDDYDEGTWTPNLNFAGGATGMTYATRDGRYRKIGSLVILWYWIILSSKGSSSGTAMIDGLPFSASGNGGLTCPVIFFDMTSSLLSVMHTHDVSPHRLVFYGLTAAATSYAVLDDADFADNSNVRACFVYHTS